MGDFTYAVGSMTRNHVSFIRISPTILVDGEHRPVVDIYWNFDTKQIDAKYEGPVSDAVKTLMDQFAEEFAQYIINMGIAIKP